MKPTTFKDIDYLACFTTEDVKSKTGFEADERSFIPEEIVFTLKNFKGQLYHQKCLPKFDNYHNYPLNN
jgi:hypothetical protein